MKKLCQKDQKMGVKGTTKMKKTRDEIILIGVPMYLYNMHRGKPQDRTNELAWIVHKETK